MSSAQSGLGERVISETPQEVYVASEKLMHPIVSMSHAPGNHCITTWQENLSGKNTKRRID
jgi:hypothetical protein